MTIKVGDLVRVSGRSDWSNGLEGEVTAVGEGNDLLLLHFKDARRRGHGVGRAHWYVSTKEASLVPTFKVGDKVFPNAISDYQERRGTVGAVSTVDDDSIPYYVLFDDGEDRWYRANELEAFVEVLKVNDFVVVTADYPAWATGRIGVIEAIDDDSFTNHLIRIPGETKEGHGGEGMGLGGHGKWWMNEDDFVRLSIEAVTPVPTEAEKAEAKRQALIDELVAKLREAFPEGGSDTEDEIEDILTRAGENFGVYLA